MRYLKDIVGPYKGHLRQYLDHAADTAIASGFAVAVNDAEVDTYLRGEDSPAESAPTAARVSVDPAPVAEVRATEQSARPASPRRARKK